MGKAMKSREERRPCIVLVPYPARGHVTPMLNLARALHARGFNPIIVCPDFIHRSIAAARSIHDLPDDDGVAFTSIPDEGHRGDGPPRDFFTIDQAMENHMPRHLERLLKSLEGVVCVVVDLLASWAIKVATDCGIPAAGFWPAFLATYRLISAIPELIRKGFISEFGIPLRQHHHYLHNDNPEGNELEEVLTPGKAKLSTMDLPWLVGNSASQMSRFAFWLRTLHRANTLRWLLVNSFSDAGSELDQEHHLSLSPMALSPRPQIFQVGPLVANNNPSLWEEDRSCIEWLGNQSPLSVVYVSLGSWVGPIGAERITELALGLEATRRPFLWALRDEPAWRACLPEGYLDRVAGQGKVVGWAPQEEVLKHEAVGCYLTHCGWNSTLEAIQHGKPLLCYPISGDQFVNCAYVVRVWGIGLKPDGVGRRAIEDGIERVMMGEEGVKCQKRVLELKKQAMGDEGKSRAAANLQCFINDAVKKEKDVISF